MLCPDPGCSLESRFDKSTDIRSESNADDAKRYDTIYGVDPLSAVLLDRSISRTWPISSYTVTISTNNHRISMYPTITYNINITGDVNKDYHKIYTPIYSTIWRYGDYAVTLNAQASNTATQGDKPFTQYIKIAEFEPFAHFYSVSGYTVPSNFSTDNMHAMLSTIMVSITDKQNGYSNDSEGSCFNFISGYAPNLTVCFQDSSEAHTFPISSYHWDFGDPYNTGPMELDNPLSNYYTISNVSILGGSFDASCWVTDKQNHKAEHRYIMPGTYDVSLTVRASCTETVDICASYLGSFDSQRFYVYVEEIPAIVYDNETIQVRDNYLSMSSEPSALIGVSPVTAYFGISSFTAGSFPIHRIDWDFGDGCSEIISMWPYKNTTSQGLPLISANIYNNDVPDARNMIVPHIYYNENGDALTYNINISAYAYNTNTMFTCSSYDMVVVDSSPLITTNEEKKLIGTRFDDKGNLICIIEGQEEGTTYTVVLSGELNND
jgi:hypothetical protein